MPAVIAFLLNPRVLIALAVAAALAAAVISFNHWKSNLIATADAAGYARAVGEMRDKELAAVKAARTEESRRTAAVQKEADDARQALAALRGTHAAAVSAGERLRAQLALAGRRGGCTANPAPADRSTPADPTADLLADVQRRLAEAEDATVRHADESRIAGLACERAYQALTP